MATICPVCQKKGERVEMTHARLPQPDLTPKGDRFPGQVDAVPAVYHPHSTWTCPQCDYKATE